MVWKNLQTGLFRKNLQHSRILLVCNSSISRSAKTSDSELTLWSVPNWVRWDRTSNYRGWEVDPHPGSTATIRCSSRNSKLVADGFLVLGGCAGIEILRLTLEIYDFLTTLTARGTDVRWKTNTFSHRKGLPCPSPKFHSFIRNLYLGHPIWTQADVSTTQFRFVASSTIWHLISIPVFPPRQAQWTFHDSGFIPLEMFKSMKPQTAVAKFTALSMLL